MTSSSPKRQPKPFVHTVNSAEDKARLERLCKEASRRIDSYMMFAGSHEVNLGSRGDHKGDTHDLGKRCDVWEARIKAWDRSQEILESGITKLWDLVHLLEAHIIRNGWEHEPEYSTIFSGRITVLDAECWLRDFGYIFVKGRLTWVRPGTQ